jgi:hypothetical protein
MPAKVKNIHNYSITNSESGFKIKNKSDCHILSKPINP